MKSMQPLIVQQSILLTWHNQECAQQSPDPFLLERIGSGHKTTLTLA